MQYVQGIPASRENANRGGCEAAAPRKKAPLTLPLALPLTLTVPRRNSIP